MAVSAAAGAAGAAGRARTAAGALAAFDYGSDSDEEEATGAAA